MEKEAKIFVVLGIFLILSFSLISAGWFSDLFKREKITGEVISCENLYWFDNTNYGCSQKEFCGTYMYYGLQVFETKGECEVALISEHSVCFPDGRCFLTSKDNGIANITLSSRKYYVELISASDTSATIRVKDIDLGVSEIKEINELDAKRIGGLDVLVKSADETNFIDTAILNIMLPNCTESDGGDNIYVKGKILTEGLVGPGEGSGGEDYCVSESGFISNEGPYLVEWFCCEGFCADNEKLKCDYGCKDGACIKEPSTGNCTDSDGGLNYYVKGTTTSWNFDRGSETDSCFTGDFPSYSGKYVMETYCVTHPEATPSESGNFKIFECPYGCTDGVCIEEPLTGNCTDTDGGINYYIQGNISVKGVLKIGDFCQDGNYLVESYCRDDGNETSIIYKCPYGCSDGVCIEEELTSLKGFRYSYWECYSGLEGKDGGESSCKTSEEWQIHAREHCQNECYKDGSKCGVNSFSVSQECYIIEPPIVCEYYCEIACPYGYIPGSCNCECLKQDLNECPPLDELSCEEGEISEQIYPDDGGCPYFVCVKKTNFLSNETIVCENSCILNGKCYPFGYRKSGEYCSDEGYFVRQLKEDSECENNFECDSNLCLNDECVSRGLIQKIFNWFKNGFRGSNR